MANELRKWENWVGGLVEDNPLASGATTLTSAGLAALPAVGSTEHMIIVFDPDGLTGAPYAKRCTAHTASATTATIEAAAIIGTARAIDRDVPWVHAMVAADLRVVRSASVYRSSNQTGIADATWTAIDWSTEYWDDLNAFDLSTDKFTTPAVGRIKVTANAELVGTDPNSAFLRVNKNSGTIICYSGGADYNTSYDSARICVDTGWRPCAASDTFGIDVFIDTASGTGTIDGDANGITAATFEFLAD